MRGSGFAELAKLAKNRKEKSRRRLFSPKAFANGIGDPSLCAIISGARGAGKTAPLSFMAEEAASRGWIAASAAAAEGMLEDVLGQATLAASGFLNSLGGRRLKGVAIGQIVGIEWGNGEPRAGDWRAQMNALLDQLREDGIGLLIAVDEVKANLEGMGHLARVCRHFVREGRFPIR